MNSIDNLHNFKNRYIVIKIDTEGFEYNVLKGASKLLKNNKVFCQVEIKDKNMNNVFTFFKKINYNLVSNNIFNKTDYFFSNIKLEKIKI